MDDSLDEMMGYILSFLRSEARREIFVSRYIHCMKQYIHFFSGYAGFPLSYVNTEHRPKKDVRDSHFGYERVGLRLDRLS